MARETRDTVAIGNAGAYLASACEKLNALKLVMDNNIDSLLNNYVGSDGAAVCDVLATAVDKLDGLILNLDYYSQYMFEIARYDSENIERAIKKINQKNKDQFEYLQNEVMRIKGGVVDGFR